MAENLTKFVVVRYTFFIIFIALIGFSACKKSRYPCPGNGQYTPQQLSLFDEEGDPKSGKKKKGRKDQDTGLLNKKKDASIRNYRRKSLDDKPKHLKK